MKPQVAPLATRALCLRIVCTSGTTIRVTRYPTDLSMSNGQVYQTGSGFDFTGYVQGSGFSPSAVDLDGILAFAGVTRAAVANGGFPNIPTSNQANQVGLRADTPGSRKRNETSAILGGYYFY